MANIIFQTSPALWPMVEFELDMIQNELNNGHSIKLLYCVGEQYSCEANNPNNFKKLSRRICNECISRRKASFKWLSYKKDNLSLIPLSNSQLNNKKKKLISKINNSHTYDEFLQNKIPVCKKILKSVDSTLKTNRRESIIDYSLCFYKFKQYLSDAIAYEFLAKKIINKFKPHKIYIYNARMLWYKPFVTTIYDYFVYEYPIYGFNKYLVHKNYLDMDLKKRSAAMYAFYNKQKNLINKNIIINIGKNWFNNRINKVSMGFEPIYTLNQKLSLLPENFNSNNFNIAFFISSQDEIDVLEGLKNKISQIQIIEHISISFNLGVDIYVRIHPNLHKNDMNFLSDLENLKKYTNITIIRADEKIDTYNLIRNSDLTITVASTVGVESSYLQKRSILFGSSLYEKFDCVDIVKSKKELINIIKDSIRTELSVTEKKRRADNACIYAWSLMNYGVESKNYFKTNYYDGYMLKNNKKYKIRANLMYIIINRVIDFPLSLFLVLKLFFKNPYNYLNKSFWNYQSFKKIFFSNIPRR